MDHLSIGTHVQCLYGLKILYVLIDESSKVAVVYFKVLDVHL